MVSTGELARRLAQGPALAYASTKMLLTKELDMSLAGALELAQLICANAPLAVREALGIG